MLAATDGLPMNFLFTGKGNDSGEGGKGLRDVIEAGAAGLKLHEVGPHQGSVIVGTLLTEDSGIGVVGLGIHACCNR